MLPKTRCLVFNPLNLRGISTRHPTVLWVINHLSCHTCTTHHHHTIFVGYISYSCWWTRFSQASLSRSFRSFRSWRSWRSFRSSRSLWPRSKRSPRSFRSFRSFRSCLRCWFPRVGSRSTRVGGHHDIMVSSWPLGHQYYGIVILLTMDPICEPWCWNMNPNICPNKNTQFCR